MMKSILSVSLFSLLIFSSALAQTDPLMPGEADMKAKNYKQANTDFTTYISSFEPKLDAYFVKLHTFDTSSAFVRSSKFADFKPSRIWAQAYFERGMARMNMSQNDDAAKDIDMATRIDPTYADPFYQQALIKKAAGDKLGSCICIGKAIANNDTMAAAKNSYTNDFCWTTGVEYFKKGRDHVDIKEYKEALSDLNMACTICPDSGNFFAYRGQAYNGIGKSDSAIADFAAAIKADPKSFYAYYYRALAYEQKQDYNDAFNDLCVALKLRPNSADAYMHRADDCENLDKESSAIYDYQQVIRLKPNDGMPYYKVALYRQKLGQDACDYFQKALDLGIDDAQSYVDDCKNAASKVLTK